MKESILAIFFSSIYATVRYNVCKGTPWADWPTYTLNKAFALSALFLLTFYICKKKWDSSYSKTEILSYSGIFAIIHVTISLIILSPTYFNKFFSEGKLTLTAGFSMLLGAIAIAIFWENATKKKKDGQIIINRGIQKLSILACIIGMHTLLQGFTGWFSPTTWPGMLPPITLISSLLGSISCIVAFLPNQQTVK